MINSTYDIVVTSVSQTLAFNELIEFLNQKTNDNFIILIDQQECSSVNNQYIVQRNDGLLVPLYQSRPSNIEACFNGTMKSIPVFEYYIDAIDYQKFNIIPSNFH